MYVIATLSDDHPMIVQSVQASTCEAIRVANEWATSPAERGARLTAEVLLMGCFLSELWLMWPLLVGPGKTQPYIGFPAFCQRFNTKRKRGVKGSSRRAAVVLP